MGFAHSGISTAIETFLKLIWADDEKRKILWDNCAAY